jgi:hypothetical protein
MDGDQNAPAIADLLAEIRRLRLTLHSDLSAAASALDADEAAVAADIIAAAASLPLLGHGALNRR